MTLLIEMLQWTLPLSKSFIQETSFLSHYWGHARNKMDSSCIHKAEGVTAWLWVILHTKQSLAGLCPSQRPWGIVLRSGGNIDTQHSGGHSWRTLYQLMWQQSCLNRLEDCHFPKSSCILDYKSSSFPPFCCLMLLIIFWYVVHQHNDKFWHLSEHPKIKKYIFHNRCKVVHHI